MLTVHRRAQGPSVVIDAATTSTLPANTIWLDLERPNEAERALVKRTTGLDLPTFDSLSEIESSSRLAIEGKTLYLSAPGLFGVTAAPPREIEGSSRVEVEEKTLYLSAPGIFDAAAGTPRSTPVGFVLNHDLLVTVRFEPLIAFEAFLKHGQIPQTSAGIFVALIETMVDRAADLLEHIGTDLDCISHEVFRASTDKDAKRGAKQDVALRDLLRQIGRHGDLASKLRETLLGLGRIVPYATSLAEEWLPEEVKPRLKTLRQDIASLNDYDAHLNNKIQFLLDAILGLINIEQNNIIKVLTVVSVVGVPPTFLASMYGMNFKAMPELDWTYGYPYALTLMVISAVAPYLWFRYRGWL